MSEVRGRSWKDPMPEERRPRGVTPCPRSGAAAESTRLRQCRNGREELPGVRGRGGGRREEIPSVRGQGQRPGGATPCPHARGQGWRREELPGAMAAWAQEGLEELPHIEGQEGRW